MASVLHNVRLVMVETSQAGNVPGPVTELFKKLRKRHPDLAEPLEAFVAAGEGAATVMSLTPTDWRAVFEDCGNPKMLHWDTKKLTPEQWMRFGEVFAQFPRSSYYSADNWEPDGVPAWFRALQDRRQLSGSVSRVWSPEWFEPVLDVAVPPDEQPLIVLRAFFSLLASSYRYSGLQWNMQHTQAVLFTRYVSAHADLVVPALADAPAGIRVATLNWLAGLPELTALVVPLLTHYAALPTKKVREKALELLATLPDEVHLAALAEVIESNKTANVADAINQAARMGEPGQAVISAALAAGRGGKRDELLAAALNRTQAAAAAPEQELRLPPVEPLQPANLGDDFATAVEEAIAKRAAQLRMYFEENPMWEWTQRELKWIEALDHDDYLKLRDYLNGDLKKLNGDAAQLLQHGWTYILPRVQGNLMAAARTFGLDWNRSNNAWILGDRVVADHDWRTLALALNDIRPVEAEAGKPGTGPRTVIEVVSEIPFTYGWNPADPDKVWPFFAEHPQRIDQELGLEPAPAKLPYHSSGDKLIALQLVSYFPVVPAKYIPVLAELATGESKRHRQAAQRILEKQPGAAQFAIDALGSGKQEVRASAAAWAGKIGDASAVEPLRAALAKEKREPVQAAMLSALQALGDDISQHLTPESLAAAAKKGLAGKPPATMAWFPLDALPECRWADGRPVDPDILRWWVVLAVKLQDPAGAGLLPIYVSLLDAESRAALGVFILDAWIAQDTACPSDAECREYAAANVDAIYARNQDLFKQFGARYPQFYAKFAHQTKDDVYEALRRERASQYLGSAIKDKGLLGLTSGVPGHHFLAVGQRFIRDHPQRRSQIEALVIAAADNPDPAAIQFVLSLARKAKQETIRAKAQELAGEIAAKHGWSLDELADRTIPTAGFEEDGLLVLDFGPRQFHGRISRSAKTGAFTIEVFDPDGKRVSALPKPGVADDEELASASRKQLTTSKKELTQVVKLQTDRLFEAMCTGRTWDGAAWKEYLATHPVMRPLISTLVWSWGDAGTASRDPGPRLASASRSQDDEGGLFRPTAEGEFIGIDDEPVEIPDDARLTLAHEVTVTPEESAAWQAHLDDYGVWPIFGQFQNTVPEFPAKAYQIEDHLGWLSDSYAIRTRATKRGYSRAQSEDGGWFGEYLKELAGAGIQVVIEFTGSFLPEEQIPAAVKYLSFRKRGRDLPLADIPPILLAECYADYVFVAEAGEFAADWEKKAGF